MNMGFVPFVYDDDAAQQTIDIAWVKIYQEDPYDLYADSEFGGDLPDDETEAPAEDTTVADETTAAEDTAPEGETTAPAVEEPTVDPAEKKGCGSAIGFGAVEILSAMAAAVALKKKD